MSYRITMTTPNSTRLLYTHPTYDDALDHLRLISKKLIREDRTHVAGNWQVKILDIDTTYEIEKIVLEKRA